MAQISSHSNHKLFKVVIADDSLIVRERLVILDIRMPGGSGIDVLQNIKQAGAGPIVIILTNYPFPGYRQKCLQAGADFFSG